jgi:HSP20 family protein
MNKKPSFFQRLTGRTDQDDRDLYEEEDDFYTRDERDTREYRDSRETRSIEQRQSASTWMEEVVTDGELAVDIFQTPQEIIVQTMVPGVQRDDLDISLSRDSITIKGHRKEEHIVSEQDYFHRELYWGTFSRAVALPHEVDIEGAEANISNGLLTIKLPRVDKGRQTKLKIKSSDK